MRSLAFFSLASFVGFFAACASRPPAPSSVAPAPSATEDEDDADESDAPPPAPTARKKSKPCASGLAACSLDGCEKSGSAHAYFNRLKRRTVAADGSAIKMKHATPVAFDAMRALQEQADPLVGQKHTIEIADRAKIGALHVGALTLGEGTPVRIAGYLAPHGHGAASGPHPGGIESVNCRLTKEDERDIHVSLVPRPDATECDGVVVEMIPQKREEHPRWTKGDLDALAKQKKKVMFVGPLFYDNEHATRPDCSVTSSQPKRMSLWEVHPVIEMYVCDDDACTENKESGWTRFE